MTKSRIGRGALALLAFALIALPMRAQLMSLSDLDQGDPGAAGGPLPDWDVATIKPHPATDGLSMSWRTTADGLSLQGLPLEQLICNAWDLKPYQVSGASGWMKSAAFDLTAKVSGDDVAVYSRLGMAARRQMLQKLLIERFQLKVHLETRTLPVYDLVVDKGGSKLQPSTAVEPPSLEALQANPEKYKGRSMSAGPGMFKATGVPVQSLARQLASIVSRPVNDITGLTGVYDITLHYRPEEGAAASDRGDEPSIFSALQEQLGFKLVPDKGPVETLVIDTAEKPDAG
jgi:uncharacterized protein (TIGR03435 family)